MKTLKKTMALILALASVMSFCAITAIADRDDTVWGSADVDASALNIRSGPSTSYKRVGLAYRGANVTILEQTSKAWYKISYNGKEGYVSSEYLTDVEKAEDPVDAESPSDDNASEEDEDPVEAVIPEEPEPTDNTADNDNTSSASTDSSSGKIAWGAGTVDTSALNVRSGPSTSYKRIGILSSGTVVVILEKTTKSWYKINYGGTIGYVSSSYLTDVQKAENFKATGTVNANKVRMRKGPSTGKGIIASYNEGDSFSVIGINNGWYKVVTQDGTGYIRSDYMDITGGGPTYSSDKSESSSLGQRIANYALQFVGYKYVYGAESPSVGFDCSGLMWYVYRQFGYKIQRGATSQYKADGVHVSRKELQQGDLVFFSKNGGKTMYHVGMYIGNGQFVHASNSRVGVIISDLDSDHYASRFYCGAHII